MDAASAHIQYKIPADRQARLDEGAALIKEFGQLHLDEELTTFALQPWTRVCHRKETDCLRGKLSRKRSRFCEWTTPFSRFPPQKCRKFRLFHP